jgi:hypothetical protein
LIGLLAWPAIFSSPFPPTNDARRQIRPRPGLNSLRPQEAVRRPNSSQATSNGAALAGEADAECPRGHLRTQYARRSWPCRSHTRACRPGSGPLPQGRQRGVQEVRRTIEKTDRALQHEEQERRAGEEGTRRQFKDVVTGGLQLESVGLVWLFLGVLFTSIPDETAAVAVSSV